MQNEKVSVVIPLYNKAHTIVRTLCSVLTQTYANLEVIIVDDGSTDNSVNTIKQHFNDTRVKVVAQANKGVSAARNRGIAEALGEFIAFIDADDEWLPFYIETVIKEAKAYPNVGLFCTSALHRDIKNGFGTFFTVKKYAGTTSIVNIFESDRLLAQTSGIVVRASDLHSYAKTGTEIFPEDMTYEEDMVTFYSFALATNTLYIGFPLSVRNYNITGQLVSQKKCDILLDSQAKYLNRLYTQYVFRGRNIPYFFDFFRYELRTRISESIQMDAFCMFWELLSPEVRDCISSMEYKLYNSKVIYPKFKVLISKILRLPYHIHKMSFIFVGR